VILVVEGDQDLHGAEDLLLREAVFGRDPGQQVGAT
jgi:hypothetical protein